MDRLARTLAALNVSDCRGATDSAVGRVLARITCDFAGGFRGDFELWSSPEAMEAFVSGFDAGPAVHIRDWHLRGLDADRTGTTYEWIDAGEARMVWTYDERLITADVRLASGDQQRLNNWWNAIGALERDD